jgi:serine/threonine-protein kinase HipA
VDDHIHNHGFLHATRGQWRLAPAFDLNPFPERLRELKTWISDTTGPEARIDALMSVTSVIGYFRNSPSRAREILAKVEQAVAQWHSQGFALGMTHRELEAFEEAFEHPERAAARRLAQ